jgi:hypothetical protein
MHHVGDEAEAGVLVEEGEGRGAIGSIANGLRLERWTQRASREVQLGDRCARHEFQIRLHLFKYRAILDDQLEICSRASVPVARAGAAA